MDDESGSSDSGGTDDEGSDGQEGSGLLGFGATGGLDGLGIGLYKYLNKTDNESGDGKG